MGEDIRKKIDELLRDVEEKMNSLIEQVEKLFDKGEYRRAYRVWREESRRVINELESRLEDIEDLLEELDKETAEKIMENVRERVDHIVDRVARLAKRIGLRYEVRKPRIFIREYIAPIEDMIEELVDSVTDFVEDIAEEIGERLSSISEKLVPTQVVSVRIKEKDLKIIDQLVEAGIFKSRSEAVAFFTRKGIEASKQWIEKALEQARKIKELQESIRRELEEL